MGKTRKANEEDSQLGKISDDDGPGWVMGTISKKLQHCMKSFRQKQMRLEELTQRMGGCSQLLS
jgi:hypothetical protein